MLVLDPVGLGRSMRLLMLCCIVALLTALPPSPVLAIGVIYVVPGGAGARTGSSWANAQDLRAALATATSGTHLWVKSGRYTPRGDPIVIRALRSRAAWRSMAASLGMRRPSISATPQVDRRSSAATYWETTAPHTIKAGMITASTLSPGVEPIRVPLSTV